MVHQILSECQYLGPDTQVHDLSKGEVELGYIVWHEKRAIVNDEPERPAKRPHVQEFVDGAQEEWAWVSKEEKYRATISILKEKLRVVNFEK